MVGFVDADSLTTFSEAVCSHYRKITGIEPLVYPVEAAEGAGLLDMSPMEVA